MAFHPYSRNLSEESIPLSSYTQNACQMFAPFDPSMFISSPPPPKASPNGAVSSQPAITPPPATITERSRRKRTTFSPDQASRLEQEYLNDCYMAREKRMILAMSLGLTENQVKTWFQNRRAKDKRDRKADISPNNSSRKTSPSRSIPSPINSTMPTVIPSIPLQSSQLLQSPRAMDVIPNCAPPPSVTPQIIQQATPPVSANLVKCGISDYIAYLKSLGCAPAEIDIFVQQKSSSNSTVTSPTPPPSTNTPTPPDQNAALISSLILANFLANLQKTVPSAAI